MNFDYGVMPIVTVLAAIVIDVLCVRYVMTVSKRGLSLRQRAVRFVLPWLAMLLATSLAATSAYNVIAMRLFWAKHPPAGSFAVVNGARMYIHCEGAGSPALVLESGLGDSSVRWSTIQPMLAKTTRVCSYDRAGFGWNQAVSGPQDADHIAAALHGLLQAAGVKGPFVLMGHSLGGLFIRDYALHYPDEVVGLVFVDASTPFQERKMGTHLESGPPSWLLQSALILGLPRLIGMCSAHGSEGDAAYRAMRAEDICRIHYEAMAGELRGFDTSSKEVMAKPSFGSLPVLIFSHDPLGTLPHKSLSEEDQKRQSVWNALQESLKTISTRSQRIIVTGGTHYLFEERPQVVVDEVALFLEEIREKAPQSADEGSTKRE